MLSACLLGPNAYQDFSRQGRALCCPGGCHRETLLPVIQALPSGDGTGGGDFCHSQHPGHLGHGLSAALCAGTQRGQDHGGRQDQEAVWGRGDPLLCRDGKGRASLAGLSRRGRKRAHTVLSRPWGRCGVSAALIHHPTGSGSAPRALCQPHGLCVSPAWLPVTLPRRAFCPSPCHIVSRPIFLQL